MKDIDGLTAIANNLRPLMAGLGLTPDRAMAVLDNLKPLLAALGARPGTADARA